MEANMVSIPVRLLVSESGFNFVLLDPEQDTSDFCHDLHEAFLEELDAVAQRLEPGTHVLTVRV
jgi:hypothetical protein